MRSLAFALAGLAFVGCKRDAGLTVPLDAGQVAPPPSKVAPPPVPVPPEEEGNQSFYIADDARHFFVGPECEDAIAESEERKAQQYREPRFSGTVTGTTAREILSQLCGLSSGPYQVWSRASETEAAWTPIVLTDFRLSISWANGKSDAEDRIEGRVGFESDPQARPILIPVRPGGRTSGRLVSLVRSGSARSDRGRLWLGTKNDRLPIPTKRGTFAHRLRMPRQITTSTIRFTYKATSRDGMEGPELEVDAEHLELFDGKRWWTIFAESAPEGTDARTDLSVSLHAVFDFDGSGTADFWVETDQTTQLAFFEQSRGFRAITLDGEEH